MAAENVRLRKNRIGSIGDFARVSRKRNRPSTSAPAESASTISGLDQPTWFPRTRPHTIPKRPALARITPGMSSEVFRP